ncbi:hypothetical protein [Shimia sp. SDUM112013]|uniref:tetratricopeptide repeat protein n=1 Tax=Shimia sp. SDUM112013 TaxID=3136160 RepID=UPI0032EAC500
MTQETEIRLSLKSVTSSDAFVASPRIVDFLTYVVEETLAGRQDAIKAKTIAMDVYGRTPQDDLPTNLVRVDAGRLRRMLDDYYYGPVNDPVRISIPKGSYVPVFEELTPTHNETSIPSSRGAKADWGLPRRASVIILLSTALFLSVGALAYLLLFQEDDPEGRSDRSAILAAQRTATFEVSPGRLKSTFMVRQAKDLIFPSFDPVRLESALNLFERAYALDSSNSDALAGVALTTSMKGLLSPPSDAREAWVEKGLALSEDAIHMAPSSAWAQISHAWALLAGGKADKAIAKAEQSAALAPQDAVVQDFQAIIYLFSGRFDEAVRVCDPTLDALPYNQRSPRMNALGVALFYLGEYEKAVSALLASAAHGAPVSSLATAYLAAAYQMDGQKGKSLELVDDIRDIWPEVDIVGLNRILFLRHVDTKTFETALKNAGY